MGVCSPPWFLPAHLQADPDTSAIQQCGTPLCAMVCHTAQCGTPPWCSPPARLTPEPAHTRRETLHCLRLKTQTLTLPSISPLLSHVSHVCHLSPYFSETFVTPWKYRNLTFSSQAAEPFERVGDRGGEAMIVNFHNFFPRKAQLGLGWWVERNRVLTSGDESK